MLNIFLSFILFTCVFASEYYINYFVFFFKSFFDFFYSFFSFSLLIYILPTTFFTRSIILLILFSFSSLFLTFFVSQVLIILFIYF